MINDLGHTGEGGPLTDTDTVRIVINVSNYPFSIPAPPDEIKTEQADISLQTGLYEYDSEVFPIDTPQNIYGLSITGEFGLRASITDGSGNVTYLEDDPNAFVRIVLIDDSNDREYLVFQKSLRDLSDEEYNSSSPLKIESVCEETCILPEVISSFSLKLEGRNAAVSISEIAYVEKPVPGDPVELRRKQNAKKIWELNRQDLGWIAGETSVSNLTYEEKKRLVNPSETDGEFNLHGFEYYRGGTFETELKNSSESRSHTSRQSSLVDNFDWRNRHGEDWTTLVREGQGKCGSCYTFSTAGAVEAVANVYFNQHLDLDLAEQDLLSCANIASADGTCNSGGYALTLLEYLIDNSISDEACFPYAEYSNKYDAYQPCSNKCSNPSESVRISGRIAFYSRDGYGSPQTEDILKEMIIENGPITASISSLGHAMNLVGFKKDPNDGRTIWIFKNSWGKGWGAEAGLKQYGGSQWGEYWEQGYAENGYAYIKLNMDNFSMNTNAVKHPIITSKSRQIQCVDNDEDGYCNWGISEEKPETCPDSCKPEKDCDDSDDRLGPFDDNYECIVIGNEAPPEPPHAAFIITPREGKAPLTVELDAEDSFDPDGSIESYEWSVKGQSVGSGNPFVYTFSEPGQPEITLTVTDNEGLKAIAKDTVTVFSADTTTTTSTSTTSTTSSTSTTSTTVPNTTTTVQSTTTTSTTVPTTTTTVQNTTTTSTTVPNTTTTVQNTSTTSTTVPNTTTTVQNTTTTSTTAPNTTTTVQNTTTTSTTVQSTTTTVQETTTTTIMSRRSDVNSNGGGEGDTNCFISTAADNSKINISYLGIGFVIALILMVTGRALRKSGIWNL
ncbi:C1 family peptidase [Desulfonema magnum]|uniref:Peptidase C1A domain-containing protein n=1 Tax=Desulfonema magnum TaxID=45655 RepID=A0A975BL45_9BACT|nr:C1 family peptidase [Desulfonema magnum]QTA87562.1 Peptidase C1A domain-containing protein [Desulfonema magnum]